MTGFTPCVPETLPVAPLTADIAQTLAHTNPINHFRIEILLGSFREKYPRARSRY
jgi:hypothetical protein